jgi:beta-phosphoglucomutase-like phosphatase (HAD superfamily)
VLVDSDRIALRIRAERIVEGRIFPADEVARGKPAPDLFLHAASRMRVAANR